jgi:hypothetical protein
MAGSLLAFISLACCGIPFLFFFKGKKIRKFSKFAYAGDEENTPHRINKDNGSGATKITR